MTIWAMLEDCVAQLDEPFRRSEIVGWFRRHHPEVNEASLGAHVQAAAANATNRARNNPLGNRPPLLRRIDRGLYVRAERSQPAAVEPSPAHAKPMAVATRPATDRGCAHADVVLIGCVRTKRPGACAAADLYDSPLFDRRRRYAIASGRPWYILSAKFALLAPDDVIGPYDVYLADQHPGYRSAWGAFVVAQLQHRRGDLHGQVIEVHAGAAYVEPLRDPLSTAGAELHTPLAHLRQGEHLAWYTTAHPTTGQPAADPPPLGSGDIHTLVQMLGDQSRALSPRELIGHGPSRLSEPGLYSWWVDARGAADISAGLTITLDPG